MLTSYTKELLPFVILFAAVIGAYCTTLDYRIRQELPLITKDCFCPVCGHKLAAVHQIPIAGFLLLGGKCHYCKAPIPLRYPLIEGGFVLLYSFLFLLLGRFPALSVIGWLLFVTLFLLLRCQGHYLKVCRALLILYLYHALFSAVLLCIHAAVRLPVS